MKILIRAVNIIGFTIVMFMLYCTIVMVADVKQERQRALNQIQAEKQEHERVMNLGKKLRLERQRREAQEFHHHHR